MAERDHPKINIKRQATLLTVNRTSVYRPVCKKKPSEENVQIMHRIDEIYMKHPYYGYRRMTRALKKQLALSTMNQTMLRLCCNLILLILVVIIDLIKRNKKKRKNPKFPYIDVSNG
ncbi:IS3 family transposase [Paenibacillus profundus]|uniref:IS3 family transposase n=1 Tax=Paenibacillus profundus TaxID=1173085 RepID=UPI003898E6AC